MRGFWETGALSSIFDKERIVAEPGFNRWLVPPAALAIHLSIGMAYGFSVFWLPLSRAVGVTRSIPLPRDASVINLVFTTEYDWPISMLGWMYTLFFVFLGGSAAVLGRWVENAGPRKAGTLAAVCWGGGLMLSALGVYVHQLWLLWLGSGVIGGIGLGLGYISPVSTLLKWFPDRRGLATGLAIMGFGGGAMVGAPFAKLLMDAFASETSVGVWQTFLVLGCVYFSAMILGAFGYRIPHAGWQPGGAPTFPHAAATSNVVEAVRYVPVTRVLHTPQFWLTWLVLCLNVSAGIGILGMASPMIQEIFGGRLIDVDAPLDGLAVDERARVATLGAAFAGLLSFFNILGRIAWASFSDYAGRKFTYTLYFLLGGLLYAGIPWTGHTQQLGLFVAMNCLIFTMYGGGFAAIPAYLADLFGPAHISAIHGRLLTAWSIAGILGPTLVNYLRDAQRADGVPAAQAYDVAVYVLAGVLLLGLICNLLIRPVSAENFVESDLRASSPAVLAAGDAEPEAAGQGLAIVVLAWSAVSIPMLWGVWNTLATALKLFG